MILYANDETQHIFSQLRFSATEWSLFLGSLLESTRDGKCQNHYNGLNEPSYDADSDSAICTPIVEGLPDGNHHRGEHPDRSDQKHNGRQPANHPGNSNQAG